MLFSSIGTFMVQFSLLGSFIFSLASFGFITLSHCSQWIYPSLANICIFYRPPFLFSFLVWCLSHFFKLFFSSPPLDTPSDFYRYIFLLPPLDYGLFYSFGRLPPFFFLLEAFIENAYACNQRINLLLTVIQGVKPEESTEKRK